MPGVSKRSTRAAVEARLVMVTQLPPPCDRDRSTLRVNPVQSVYIDPSVIEYLYMEPTPRIISSIRQAMTFKWFELLEEESDIVATPRVAADIEREGIRKPSDCADIFHDLRMLEITPEVTRLAEEVIPTAFHNLDIPADEFSPHPIHIAAAAEHEVQFLLTWDCIDSHVLPAIDNALRGHGFTPAAYKTPAEMLEERGFAGTV